MLGFSPISDLAFSELPAALAYGSQSITLRVGTHSFATRTTDTPASEFITGRIISGPLITREIDQAQDRSWGGLLQTRYGEVVISNIDGAFDFVAQDWFFDGRDVRFLLGEMLPEAGTGRERVEPFDDFDLVYTAVAGSLEMGHSTMVLRLRDRGLALQERVQSGVYAGSGGSEGTSDMAGRTRPLAFGRLLNASAQQVDPSIFTYQIHDGSIAAVTTVYDAGVSLTFNADHANYAALAGATVPGGQYDTCLAEGYLRLGTSPTGGVTVDLDGANSGGWSASHAEVMKRILDDYSTLDASEIDATSFSDFDTLQPSHMGYFLPSGEETSIEEALTRIAFSGGAVIGQDRTGLYRVFRLDAPAVSAARSFASRDIIDVDRVPLPYGVPWKRWTLQYQHNWTIQTDADLAGSVGQARRRFVESQARSVSVALTDVALAHRTAGTILRPSLFHGSSDTSDEANRLAALYSLGRSLWRIRVKGVMYAMEVGETVRVVHPRERLTNGVNMVVVTVSDDHDRLETEFLGFG